MTKLVSIAGLIVAGFILQESGFRLIRSIPASSGSFTTDNLENSYLIKKNILEKYDTEGTLQRNFSHKNLGDITFADVHDPMKILLFYKAFQQILFVDNMLVPSGLPISLDALGYNRVTLACTSHNNGFWIYDQQNAELIRFDRGLQKTRQTGNIIQLTGTELNPDFVTEYNNQVFLNDSAKGILVFDIYGTYSKTIPLRGLTHFQVSNDAIFYTSDVKLKSYNIKTLEESEKQLPSADILDARTGKEKLYLLKQKSLDIYSVVK